MQSSTHHMRDQESSWLTLEECKLLQRPVHLTPELKSYISWLNANETVEQDHEVLPLALGGAS